MEHEITWKLSRKIIVCLASMVVLSVLLFLTRKINPAISIPDSGLERVIREKIERETGLIYKSDLMDITELNAASQKIISLSGLEYCQKLTVLNLENNQIQDLSPLQNLNLLKELDLENNQITDLRMVNFQKINHLHLRELNLSKNREKSGKKLTDISLIEPLNYLEKLDLSHNAIMDITALEAMTNLQELDLRENSIEDIESLSFLENMIELNLRENEISNIQSLSHLTKLSYLNIRSNPIDAGIEKLCNLKHLKTLIMRDVYIGDNYDFLNALTELQYLNIRNTGISEIVPLVNLMKQGALQDNSEIPLYATVNLLQVDISEDGSDPYQELRPFWENIAYRNPIDLPYSQSSINQPQFSHQSGFYEDGFFLELTADETDFEIYYSTDGSKPSINEDALASNSTKLYTVPIFVENRSQEPNVISNIPTGRALTEEIYTPPPVFKATIIRAIAVDSEGNSSNIASGTYFVDPNMVSRYTMPIVSLITDPKNFFDDEIGIYVPGNQFQDLYPDNPWRNPGNYSERGLAWERPVFIQMFTQEGETLFSLNAGIRIHGDISRSYPQKSLRIYAGSEYDLNETIPYSFFPELESKISHQTVDEYSTIILRHANPGHDRKYAIIRDGLAHSLMSETTMDIQGFQPVILFINGEYWGIQKLRARYDEQYFSDYYQLESDEIIVLENGSADVYIGDPGDEKEFETLYEIIDPAYQEKNYHTTNNLADQEKYEQLSALMDMNNFITYNVAEIYFSNSDWPYKNSRFWRKKTVIQNPANEVLPGHDGKWRWMLLDIDMGFRDVQLDSLEFETQESMGEKNYLLRSLLENDPFRNEFINQFANHLNTTFREEVVLTKIDEFEMMFSPEIEEHMQRWGTLGNSHQDWLLEVNEIREFAQLRPGYMREYIVNYFDLAGVFHITLQTDSHKGYIQINGIDIQEGVPGVDSPEKWEGIYFQGIPVEITAVPKEGYQFVRWSGLNIPNTDITVATQNILTDDDLKLIAIFAEE